MKLPLTLAGLLDEASPADSPDHFLAALGAQLIADDLPLAGGALTLAAPHPMIARRTWLWRGGGRGGGGGRGCWGLWGFGPGRARAERRRPRLAHATWRRGGAAGCRRSCV